MVAFLHAVIQGLGLILSQGSAIPQGLTVICIQLAEEEGKHGEAHVLTALAQNVCFLLTFYWWELVT